MVEGEISFEEINEFFGSSFESEEFHSLGGLLLNKFDKVPKKGDKTHIGNLAFEITKTSRTKILEVKIRKL